MQRSLQFCGLFTTANWWYNSCM